MLQAPQVRCAELRSKVTRLHSGVVVVLLRAEATSLGRDTEELASSLTDTAN